LHTKVSGPGRTTTADKRTKSTEGGNDHVGGGETRETKKPSSGEEKILNEQVSGVFYLWGFVLGEARGGTLGQKERPRKKNWKEGHQASKGQILNKKKKRGMNELLLRRPGKGPMRKQRRVMVKFVDLGKKRTKDRSCFQFAPPIR